MTSGLLQRGRAALIQIGPVVVRAPDLRVAFRVKKTIKSHATTPNEATIQIFNLAQKSRRKLDEAAENKWLLSIQAGYVGQSAEDFDPAFLPRVYLGTVVSVLSFKSGTELVTEIQSLQHPAVGASMISTALKPGAKKSDTLKALLEQLQKDNPTVDITSAMERVQRKDFVGAAKSIASGISLIGQTQQHLQLFAREAGLETWIDDDGVKVSASDETPKGLRAVLLTARSGLIGELKRVYDQKNPKAFIVRAQALMNGEIAIGRQVVIRSAGLEGTFRVRAVSYNGDSHGQEWTTELEAVMLSEVKYTDGTKGTFSDVPVTPTSRERVGP